MRRRGDGGIVQLDREVERSNCPTYLAEKPDRFCYSGIEPGPFGLVVLTAAQVQGEQPGGETTDDRTSERAPIVAQKVSQNITARCYRWLSSPRRRGFGASGGRCFPTDRERLAEVNSASLLERHG